jgi:hypothetical protein
MTIWFEAQTFLMASGSKRFVKHDAVPPRSLTRSQHGAPLRTLSTLRAAEYSANAGAIDPFSPTKGLPSHSSGHSNPGVLVLAATFIRLGVSHTERIPLGNVLGRRDVHGDYVAET